jgi:hypothetical protein
MKPSYPFGINMALLKQDYDGVQCPVCKVETIDAERAHIGYRIEPSQRNFDEHGFQVIFHNMNTAICCSPACANRVTVSWSGVTRSHLREELIHKIKEDIAKFLEIMSGHYGYNGIGKVKRLTKAEYKELHDKARASGTLIKA